MQAGNYLRDDTVSSTLQIVSAAPLERQAYAAMRLWSSLERAAAAGDCTERQPLIQVTHPTTPTNTTPTRTGLGDPGPLGTLAL